MSPTANLSARLMTIARAGALVIPRAAARLAGGDDLEIGAVRRTFDFKGIGNTRVATVRRAAARGEAI